VGEWRYNDVKKALVHVAAEVLQQEIVTSSAIVPNASQHAKIVPFSGYCPRMDALRMFAVD